MPDSQSSEPGFESRFATVSKIGRFRSLHWRSSWLSCINEYLAIDSGGNVNDLVFARNCSIARMLPEEADLVSEWTGLPGRAKRVKRFELSNGPDIALYKNYVYLFLTTVYSVVYIFLGSSVGIKQWAQILERFLCLPFFFLNLDSLVFFWAWHVLCFSSDYS